SIAASAASPAVGPRSGAPSIWLPSPPADPTAASPPPTTPSPATAKPQSSPSSPSPESSSSPQTPSSNPANRSQPENTVAQVKPGDDHGAEGRSVRNTIAARSPFERVDVFAGAEEEGVGDEAEGGAVGVRLAVLDQLGEALVDALILFG